MNWIKTYIHKEHIQSKQKKNKIVERGGEALSLKHNSEKKKSYESEKEREKSEYRRVEEES